MNYKEKVMKKKDLEILEQYINMRCFCCRRRLNRIVYYYNSFQACLNCFEDILTEDFLAFNPEPDIDPTSVAEINDII